MKRYKKINDEQIKFNDMTDRSKIYFLTPSERKEIQKNINNDYSKNLALFGIERKYKYFENRKLDRVTETIFKSAMEQMDIINTTSQKVFNEKYEELTKDTDKMADGEIRVQRLDYTDVYGQRVINRIGIEKRKDRIYFFEIKYENRDRTIVYDSEHKIMNNIKDYARNTVKQLHGIGEEVFKMEAQDGTKFIITDPRDEKKDKRGEHVHSFEKGFTNFNMYRVTPDGERTLMNKEDVIKMVNDNGIDIRDVNARKTMVLRTVMDAVRTVGMMKGKVDRTVQEGMDLTTSTRS